MIAIKKTPQFEAWYKSLIYKEQTQIDARLLRIETAGHFGDAKYLSEGLAELRWKNGWRVLTACINLYKSASIYTYE